MCGGDGDGESSSSFSYLVGIGGAVAAAAAAASLPCQSHQARAQVAVQVAVERLVDVGTWIGERTHLANHGQQRGERAKGVFCFVASRSWVLAPTVLCPRLMVAVMDSVGARRERYVQDLGRIDDGVDGGEVVAGCGGVVSNGR